ncbi:hypothetical protein FRB94_005794 [Tulasnella sp. JGI-2019a]|nr:hypothetical protein FRB94_005794 [Tulasnella sp. JGI-2019a]KAG9031698.1 hypothetical protein FRB95_002437 [Tulasnella sp. JGI-2019a]
MGESRTELLEWLNSLLQINYNKVEQCGTGGAYCQVMDSIYGDVPMTRVKMNAKHEYEFLANYKVLQNVFKAHKVDKPIPVDKLSKCKMQDNLEFMQWLRRFWDQNSPGGEYDAVARRKGAAIDTPHTIAPVAPRARTTASGGSGLAPGGPARPTGGKTPTGGPRATSGLGGNAAHAKLHEELKQHKEDIEALEMERNFYFNKLRDIEILVQTHMDGEDKPEGDIRTEEVLKNIQAILYKTEDGFEPPAEGEEEETF